jgi:hypothetical protein
MELELQMSTLLVKIVSVREKMEIVDGPARFDLTTDYWLPW